ncbi:MAG: HAD-IC family P-type ATPase, partial [Patescibacteria group bacterium]
MPHAFSSFTHIDTKETLTALHASATGLSEAEVSGLKKEFGRNQFASSKTGALRIFARQFQSPFIYLLIAAAVLAWILGEHIDGLVIFGFVFVNAVISFYQEYRSEQTVKLLKKFIAPKTRVRRDGQEVEVDRTELVPGDIVLVSAGDMIPADLRWLTSNDLLVDESILTGESVAVQKKIEALEKQTEATYEATNIGFCGTTVIGGRAEGVIVAIGAKTVLGEIARVTVETERVSGFNLEIKA